MKFLVVGLLIKTTMMLITRIYESDIAWALQFQIYSGSKRVVGIVWFPQCRLQFHRHAVGPLFEPALFADFKAGEVFRVCIAIVLGGTALLLTMSRGGWLAAADLDGHLLLVAYRQGWLSAKVLVLILIPVWSFWQSLCRSIVSVCLVMTADRRREDPIG